MKKENYSQALTAIAAFFIAAVIFCLIGNKILTERETSIDIFAFNQLKHIKNSVTTKLMINLTFFGSRNFLLPTYALLCICLLYITKDYIVTIFTAVIGSVGNGLWILMQYLFHRQRPPDPLIEKITDFGFPSGHSFSAFTFFGLLIYFTTQTNLSKPVKISFSICFLLMAALIAISRVYLHMHYATDIIGGCLLAIAWLIVCLSLLIYSKQNFFKQSK